MNKSPKVQKGVAANEFVLRDKAVICWKLLQKVLPTARVCVWLSVTVWLSKVPFGEAVGCCYQLQWSPAAGHFHTASF